MSTTELDTVKNQEQESQTRIWRRPYYDVMESDSAFDVKISVPGVNREGVNISIKGENLNITARRVKPDKADVRILRRELPEGDYRLNLRLNVSIDEDNVQASVENGILSLILPKSDESRARKIEIS